MRSRKFKAETGTTACWRVIATGGPWQLHCRRKTLRTLEVERKASFFCSVFPASSHDKGERFESRSGITKHSNERWTCVKKQQIDNL